MSRDTPSAEVVDRPEVLGAPQGSSPEIAVAGPREFDLGRPGDASTSIEVIGMPDATATPISLPFERSRWEVALGKWTFESGGEFSCDGSGVSSVMYRAGERPRDFTASVEVMFFGPESSAGILFRENGDNFFEDATFYQYEWYTAGSHHDKRLSLMRKNPYWVQIVEPQYPDAPFRSWVTLGVRARGDHIETFLNGKPVFDQHDATFLTHGRIGVHVFQPRPVRFRNFMLREDR